LLALAGGVVLGLAAARFLKASSSSRYEGRSAQRPQATGTTAPVAPTASLQGQEVGGEAIGAAVPPPEAPAPAVAGTPST
jgi:hypothetical protein